MKSHKIELLSEDLIFDKDGKLIEHSYSKDEQKLEDTIEFTLKDKNGKEIGHKEIYLRSFVNNFMSVFSQMNNGEGTLDYTNLAGDAESTNNISFLLNGEVGETDQGIVAGTGTTSPAATDYCIGTLIAHGTSAGQLSYSAMSFDVPVADGLGYRLTARRTLTNSSGGSITIKECAVYVETAGAGHFMILKDRVDKDGVTISVTVPDSITVEIKYNFRISGTDGLLLNWLKILYSQFTNSAYSITNTAGSPTSQTWTDAETFFTNALVTNDVFGIVVGTGTNSVALTDNALQTKIAHGTGAGQLSYGAMEFDAYVSSGGIMTKTIKRTFTNNTTGTITARESGIYIKGSTVTTEDGKKVCIARKGEYRVLQAGQSWQKKFTFRTRL